MITGAETAHLMLKTPTIYLEGRLPLIVVPSAAELNLRDGQVVQGTIESRIEGLRLQLQGPLHGQYLNLPQDAPASLRLSAGDTALYKVQILANGTLVLRPLQANPPPPSPASPPAAAATLPDRLQQLSFRPPDMSALSQWLRPGFLESLLIGLNPAGPEMASLQNWLRMRTSMAQLSPEKLMQLIKRSGWMTEHLLAHGQGHGMIDLKSVLRQLVRSMQTTDPEKAKLTRDALDDVESHQLWAADTLHGKEWVFSMMLPFSDAEPVTLRMLRSKQQTGHDKPPLIIHLHTRNQDLGEIWLQTKISNETQVDMVMWALREDVVERAKAQTKNLEQELDSAGLHMTRLQVIHGEGPQAPMAWSPPETGSLLDVKT